MSSSGSASDILTAEIRNKEAELSKLKADLTSLENSASAYPASENEQDKKSRSKTELRPAEFRRYGRQMILPEIGLPNQLKLRNASILVIGLGGLGCPAAAYLAGAGVGKLGLVDGDIVEISNLHRQILHHTQNVGKSKVESAAEYIRRLNPLVDCELYPRHLSPESALDIFANYDLVLDCTDHPAARYLVSDAAVCSGIPLISAAALKTDGQLLVLNNPPFHPSKAHSGPCYRCINPKPPPAQSIISCGEGGILGPVVGTMGVLMATEAIKIIASPRFPFSKYPVQDVRNESTEMAPTTMLIYSALSSTPFRSIKLRGRKINCPACASSPDYRSISADTLRSGSLDYAAFCGMNTPVKILPASQRITPRKLKALSADAGHLRQQQQSVLILDVRDATQFGICRLQDSVNIPIADLEARNYVLNDLEVSDDNRPVVIVCRFGNDSQLAVQGIMQNRGLAANHPLFDLEGGLEAWRREIDPAFPEY